MNDIIPIDRALVPNDQIESIFSIFVLFDKRGDIYCPIFEYALIHQHHKYFLMRTRIVAKQTGIGDLEFTNMVNLLSTSPLIPVKYQMRVIEYSKRNSIDGGRCSAMLRSLEKIKEHKKRQQLTSKQIIKYYKLQEILSQKDNIVVKEIKFSAQLLSLIEQKSFNHNYITFLKEYSKEKGEKMDDYLGRWAKALMQSINIDEEFMTRRLGDRINRNPAPPNKGGRWYVRKKDRRN